MDNRSLGYVVAIILVASVAIGVPLAAPTGGAQRPPAGAATAQDKGVAQGAAIRTGSQLLAQSPAAGARCRLRVVIVALPDPVDSRLDWAFDSELEAAFRAFESAGYVRERFWFPASRDSVAGVPARYVLPGVAVLRSGADDLLLAYFVGESPTRGIYGPALRTALAERGRLLMERTSPCRGGADTLLLVAPSFTGSRASLLNTLTATLTQDSLARTGLSRVEVISPTATSLHRGALDTTLARGLPLRIRATVNSDASIRAAVARAFATLGIRWDDVAFLTESSTEYGREWVRNDSGPLQLPFPMNISSLREEYARLPTPTDAGRSTQEAPRVPLVLVERNRSADALPLQSDLTAPAVDIILDGIAQTLREERITTVVIIATDVRDKLFLGTELRRRIHGLRLVVLESNVLYLRPDFNAQLRGMLVVSSYPLVPAAQAWADTARRAVPRMFFPNEGAEGTYNAVLWLLGRGDLGVDYRMPGAARTGPAVWVTVIGRDASFPLLVMLPADTGYTVGRPSTAAARRAHSAPASRFTLLLVLAGAGLAVRGGWKQKGKVMRLRRVAPGSAWEATSTQLMLFRVQLLGALVASLAPFVLIVFLNWKWGPYRWLAFAALVSLLYALVCMVVMGAALRGRWHVLVRGVTQRTERWLLQLTGVVTVAYWAVTLALCDAILTQRFARSWSEWPALAHRALTLDSGVSPLLPLLLIGVCIGIWCHWHIARIESLSGGETEFEHLHGSDALAPLLLGKTRGKLRRLRPAVARLVPAGTWIRTIVLVVAAAAFLCWLDRTLDGHLVSWSFDVLLLVGLAFGLLATMWAVMRLWRFWTDLRAVLAGLRRTPLLPAFERLPEHLGRLVRMSSSRGDADAVFEHAMEAQWSRMRRLAAALPAGTWDAAVRVLAPVSHKGRLGDVALLLEEGWALEPSDEDVTQVNAALAKKEERLDLRSTVGHFRRTHATPQRLVLRCAEEQMATQAAAFLAWATDHLRTLSVHTLASLLTVVALTSAYPITPYGMVRGLVAALVVAAVGTIVVVMVETDRDDVLSRISKTDPGQVTWDLRFIGRLLMFGAVPLLGLLSSGFPELRGFLFDWLEPLARSVSRLY